MFKNEYFAADYDGIQGSSVNNYIITSVFYNICVCVNIYISIIKSYASYEYMPIYTYVYIQIPFYPS